MGAQHLNAISKGATLILGAVGEVLAPPELRFSDAPSFAIGLPELYTKDIAELSVAKFVGS